MLQINDRGMPRLVLETEYLFANVLGYFGCWGSTTFVLNYLRQGCGSCGPPDIADLHLPSSLTNSHAWRGYWEIGFNNIWRARGSLPCNPRDKSEGHRNLWINIPSPTQNVALGKFSIPAPELPIPSASFVPPLCTDFVAQPKSNQFFGPLCNHLAATFYHKRC